MANRWASASKTGFAPPPEDFIFFSPLAGAEAEPFPLQWRTALLGEYGLGVDDLLGSEAMTFFDRPSRISASLSLRTWMQNADIFVMCVSLFLPSQ